MVKIRITQGVFGLREGIFTQTKTRKDPPFEVDNTIAARLVAQGVAEIVTSDAETASNTDTSEKTTVRLVREVSLVNKGEADEAQTGETTKTEENGDDDSAEDENQAAAYSMDNTKVELLAIAEEFGIAEANSTMNKTQIIALLDAHTEGETAEGGPSFTDFDGVVE